MYFHAFSYNVARKIDYRNSSDRPSCNFVVTKVSFGYNESCLADVPFYIFLSFLPNGFVSFKCIGCSENCFSIGHVVVVIEKTSRQTRREFARLRVRFRKSEFVIAFICPIRYEKRIIIQFREQNCVCNNLMETLGTLVTLVK